MGSMLLQGDFEKRKAFQRRFWPDPEIVPDEMIHLKYNATRWENIRRTYFKSLRSITNVWGIKKSVYAPIVQGLPSLKTPVLVIWGEQDELLPASQAQIVKDQIPQAQIEIFTNCGHDPMVTNPLLFNQLVLEFLKSADSV